jgi:predicted permease
MSDFLHDVRYALRALRRSPGFTVTATLTLAVGIGANTAIFGMLDRLLLRSLPVEAPDRLVHVVTDRGEEGRNYNLSYPAFAALAEDSTTFAGVLAYQPLDLGLTGSGGTVRVAAGGVSASYFRVLGLRPAAGRWFGPGEAGMAGGATVAVVAQRWARRTYGTDADVVGREIRLNDRPYTIVGLVPEGFEGLVRGGSIDLWVPLGAVPQLTEMGDCPERPNCSWLSVFARLAPGVSREAAQARLAVGDAGRIAAGLQFDGERRLLLDGGAGLTYRVGALQRPLTVLMAAVAMLLLIACGNVAGLLLVRARGRRREIGVRLALGAGRARLVRQLLTESLVLSVAGGAAGLLVAMWATNLLAGYRTPGGEALAITAGIDGRVLVFAALVSLATVLLFGLVPALGASRAEVVSAIKGAAAGHQAGSRRRVDLRDGLVVAQVALSVVLVVGAVLLTRSVRNLGHVDVGFEPQGVLLARVDVEVRQYDGARTSAFYGSLLERVGALPGVEGATLATTVWPNPGGSNWGGLRLEGFTGSPDDVSFDVNRVGPDYFATLGVPLLQGRGIEARDGTGPMVAVVNETMARRYWPAGDALGRRIYLDSTRAIEIVGIARDGKYRELREAAQATLFLSLLRLPLPTATLMVRSSGDPQALAPAVRRAVTALDAAVPVFDVQALETHVSHARARERLAADVTGLFGLVSLGLAALGLYGLLAAAVRQRVREIGIRVALGARPGDVTRLVVSRAGALVGAGAVLGTAGAAFAARLIGDLLYGVAPADPASFVTAAGALLVVGLAAGFVPARRAARIPPMEALRHE